MKKNTLSPARLKMIGLLCIVGLLLVGFTQALGRMSVSQLRAESLNLEVPALQQLWGTSCGEAVIAMTYNYAYPDTPITEVEVIQYAKANQYYTETLSPYTSPANMVKIARNYTREVSTGSVFSPAQGLALLTQKLRKGEPVIIDVLSNFNDPQSEAHFIVVTGITIDPDREDAIVIHYNDPLTGTQQTGDWTGAKVFGTPGTRTTTPAEPAGGL